MNSLDLLSMAVRNLFKRKLRTLLTVFGVVIGTSAIVVMVSLGIALNENFINEMSNWGNLQVINVSNPAFHGGVSYDENGNVKAADKKLVLDDKMFEKFKGMGYVEAVTPIVEEYLIIGAGKLTTSARIIGVFPEAMPFLGLKTTDGRLLEDGDTTQVVMGKQIPLQFTNPNQDWRQQRVGSSNEDEPLPVMEEKLIITYDWGYGTRNADKSVKSTKVECVGILEGDGYDKAYSVYMPIAQLKKIQDARTKHEQSMWGGSNNNNNKKIKGYQQCWVKVSDMKQVVGVQDQIKELGFDAWSQAEYLDSMNNMMQGIQMFLGAIGGVALFVAAIGIINTMIMSIYERTREIGVMKVIAASLGDIAKLFLVEAAFIGFLGGIVGLIFSYTISYILNTYGTDIMASVIGSGGDAPMKVSSIPIWLALSALIFASIIGIIAGFLPARRAMKLSALSAIRTE